jgi:hypothetical protein
VTVEALYIADCLSYEVAASSVRHADSIRCFRREVALSRISTAEQAERERFLGSPTVPDR